ncbi:MAG: O-antigen ligase family protein [Defluviitaleaceae bacterium]|nr:O-antigen ligase family protein [Defluviitaleaceae bacterium]
MRFIRLWMDGSLFFRGIGALLDFTARLFAGSFIANGFAGDVNINYLTHSRYVSLIKFIFNRIPKVINVPERWPKKISSYANGSFAVSLAAHAAGQNIPLPFESGRTKIFEKSLSVIKWIAAVLPVWGTVSVLFFAPFLPTMALAAIVAASLVAALLSREIIVDATAAALLFFIAVTIICGFASLAPASSIPIAVLSSLLIMSYILVISCIRTKKTVDIMFFLFAVSAAAAGIAGLYQFFFGRNDARWLDNEVFDYLNLRVFSTFGNPNVYGTYLLLAVPFCAAFIFYAKKPLYKLLAAATAALLLINLAATYSRGCYLALAVSALVFVLLWEKRFVVAAAAVLAAAPFVLPAAMWARLVSIVNFADMDSSTAYRVSIWQASLRIVKDFWMTGLGQGIEAYNVAYPFYAFNAVTSPHSHNLYLQILVETGVIGLSAFIAALAFFFRTQFTFMRRAANERDRLMSAVTVAAAVGFLFQGIFDHVFYNYRVMLIFFVFLGISNAYAAVRSKGNCGHEQ